MVEIGLPGHATCLHAAMNFASSEVVVALLESGARPDVIDVTGTDVFMGACMFGRLDNVKEWLSYRPGWNVNSENKLFGATALNIALGQGVRNLDLVTYLLKRGANVSAITYTGNSCLHDLSMSNDCDPRVLRYLLERLSSNMISNRKCGGTRKWKCILTVMPILLRCDLFRSNVIKHFGNLSGTTALHCAARRGDLEAVEILLEHGANPKVRDSVGRDVLSCCHAFPAIGRAIQRVMREKKRIKQKNDDKKSSESSSKSGLVSKVKSVVPVSTGISSSNFTLQRRLSTATSLKYDMYLINLGTMLNLFGSPSDRKTNFNLCHQDLLEQGKLTRFEDLPLGTFIIFVSHQWNSFNHPDPNGRQMQVRSVRA